MLSMVKYCLLDKPVFVGWSMVKYCFIDKPLFVGCGISNYQSGCQNILYYKIKRRIKYCNVYVTLAVM